MEVEEEQRCHLHFIFLSRRGGGEGRREEKNSSFSLSISVHCQREIFCWWCPPLSPPAGNSSSFKSPTSPLPLLLPLEVLVRTTGWHTYKKTTSNTLCATYEQLLKIKKSLKVLLQYIFNASPDPSFLCPSQTLRARKASSPPKREERHGWHAKHQIFATVKGRGGILLKGNVTFLFSSATNC